MRLTSSYVRVKVAEKVTMKPVNPPEQIKINFFPEPPPAPTHQPKIVKPNREGPYKRPQSQPTPQSGPGLSYSKDQNNQSSDFGSPQSGSTNISYGASYTGQESY